MPKKRASRPAPRAGGRPSGAGGRSGPGGTVLAFILGAGAAAGAGYLYLHSTPAKAPAPAPSPAAQPASRARPPAPAVAAAPPSAPFGISEDVFEAGAHTYTTHCSSCHGSPRKDAPGQPAQQQLWRAGKQAVIKAAPGTLYTEIADGTPAHGMPAFASTLTETQIWQIALLLHSAGSDLPDPVLTILNTPARR